MIQEKGIRDNDILGRYGGEEFVVILPKTAKTQALEIAERIRANIASHQFLYEGTPIKLTVSCGVASLKENVKDHIAFFKLADKAAYQAKNQGRNKVCFSTE